MDTNSFDLIYKRQQVFIKGQWLRDIKDRRYTKMDPKHQENYLKKYDEKSLEKLQSRVVFADQTHLFIFKKTEKIIAALYLVTNLISDTEPLKRQVRKVSLGLMSDILALKRLSSVEAKQIIVGLVAAISEIISLLKIASVTDHISPMNYSVLQKELAMLMSNLETVHPEVTGNGGVVLSQDFFNVPMPVSPLSSSANYPAAHNFLAKGQYRTPVGIKDNQVQPVPKDNPKDIKDGRRGTMLQLLRAGKPLGIKDFAREIKGCGEKTIQRELLSMVGSGVLKKTGERRWSLYSLA